MASSGNETTRTYVIHHCTNASNCWNLVVLLLLLLFLGCDKPPAHLFSSSHPHFTGLPFASIPWDLHALILTDFFLPWTHHFTFFLTWCAWTDHWLIHPLQCSLTIPTSREECSAKKSCWRTHSSSPGRSTVKKCTHLSYHGLADLQDFLCITVKQPDLPLILYWFARWSPHLPGS